MNVPLQHLPKLILCEAIVWRRWLVAGFILISLSFVAIGSVWPKIYTASATVYVEERSIIQPLMQGTAVATNVTDRSKIAREILFSRKMLTEVLEHGGWLANDPTELQQERMLEAVKEATYVSNVGGNLVRIEYADENPKRAYETAQKFADLFIKESAVNQARESTDAFEFIDGQVKVYHAKLMQAEQALKEFRSQYLDARPGTEAEITSRIATLQGNIERTTLALKEAQIKQSSLEKQLSGEAILATSLTREGQYVARIADLQTQLDGLRLSYHDSYPDIMRLKYQIDELRDLVDAERKKREEASQAFKSGNPYVVDETVRVSPIYQRLRSDLLDTKTNIETLTTRLNEMKQLLYAEQERAKKLYGGEAMLAELTRDYEVNREIYHDLLKRRENARVSKNLDANRQGLTMRLHEPAVIPLRPSGLRFQHFAAAGVLLGLAIPLAILVVLLQIDPRLRIPALITERLNLPVLAAVPRLVMASDVVRMDRSLNRMVMLMLLTFATIAAVGMLKYMGRL